MGDGMEQIAARRSAIEKNGIAIHARKGSSGKWSIGGWHMPDDVWIVVAPGTSTVLDDGPEPRSDGRRLEDFNTIGEYHVWPDGYSEPR